MRNKDIIVVLVFLCCSIGLFLDGCSPPVSTCGETCVEASTPDSSEPTAQPEPEPTDGPRQPAVNLLDHTKWSFVSDNKDPFLSMKKSTHKCDRVLGQKIEDGVLEVDTTYCNYITLEQTTQTEVRPGEQLQFAMWHLDLFATTPGEAFVTITIDGQTVWKKTIPVPFKAEFYEPKWTPKAPIPKGARIVFHLHNHGANTWKIHSLTTGIPF